MKVFVTRASGFIGAPLVRELIDDGHRVLGLARSEESARVVAKAGAEVHRGDVTDLESLRKGAAAADATIHLAFNHDFSRFKQNAEDDRAAIEAMGSEIVGADKLLIVTSGTAISSVKPGLLSTESDEPMSSQQFPRAASEEAANTISARGGRVAIVRLPQVHDTSKQGLITYQIAFSREKGVSAYIGDGRNRWPAAHVSDVSRLYRLALEKGQGGVRYHAVAEEGVSAREIAETVGKKLNLPVRSITAEEAPTIFGWFAHFAAWDVPASSAQTRKQLVWNPIGPTLLTDLQNLSI